MVIREHAGPGAKTKVCFDEWGTWHPEATFASNQNQRQTLRDAIFAALALHIFYRNCDIVEFAMETQLCNLLQSLFETCGEKCYRTPTFYVMNLLKDHLGQQLASVLPDDIDEDLDVIASVSEDGQKMTLSLVNRHLHDSKAIAFQLPSREWKLEKADIITADDIHAQNTFDEPEVVRDRPFSVLDVYQFELPPHSIVRIALKC